MQRSESVAFKVIDVLSKSRLARLSLAKRGREQVMRDTTLVCRTVLRANSVDEILTIQSLGVAW